MFQIDLIKFFSQCALSWFLYNGKNYTCKYEPTLMTISLVYVDNSFFIYYGDAVEILWNVILLAKMHKKSTQIYSMEHIFIRSLPPNCTIRKIFLMCRRNIWHETLSIYFNTPIIMRLTNVYRRKKKKLRQCITYFTYVIILISRHPDQFYTNNKMQ